YKLGVCLEYLIQNSEVSSEILTLALDYLKENPEDNSSREIAYGYVFYALVRHRPVDEWWPTLWELLHDEDLIGRIIGLFMEREQNTLDKLSSAQLQEFYTYVATIFKYEEDIDFQGGLIPLRHHQEEFRDKFLY